MIIVDCEQGSKEWHLERAGVITASMFSTIREKLKSGPNKGGYKKAAEDYAFRLAIERISGEPLDGGYETWAMQRGHEMEPEARLKHEEKIGVLIEHAGIVLTDDRMFGGSADGLINDDGGSEYKCLVAPEKIRSIIVDKDIDEFKDQVQGCLWLTGREWWHFCLYCPALKQADKDLIIIKVERDDDYIAEMEKDLLEFNQLVESYKAALLEKAA